MPLPLAVRSAPSIVLAALAVAAPGCASRPPLESAPSVAQNNASRFTWSVIGHSLHRQPIEATTLGHGPRRIYLIGLIHGDEPEGLAILPQLCEELNHPDLLEMTAVRLVRNMNPDGAKAGSRGNARGVDLNRNWPARNFTPSTSRGDRPLSEPETLAVYADLLTFRPELVIVLHSTVRGGPFVNFDGPAASIAERFAAAAAELDPQWHTRADMGYATPGSLGTYIGVDRRIPILTVEFARGRDADAAALAGLLAAIRYAANEVVPTGTAEVEAWPKAD